MKPITQITPDNRSLSPFLTLLSNKGIMHWGRATMSSSATTKKVPKPVDVHVGNRVRMRRMKLGMSQEKLGTPFASRSSKCRNTKRVRTKWDQVACSRWQIFWKCPSHSFLKTHLAKPNRVAKLPHQTMFPIFSPRRMDSRSRKPLCESKTQSSGEPS